MSDEIPMTTKQQQIDNAAALIIALVGEELAEQAQNLAGASNNPFEAENTSEKILELVLEYLNGNLIHCPNPPMLHQLTYKHAAYAICGGEGE